MPDSPAHPYATSAGDFTLKVLNGISIAVVVSLVPQALLGELFKALLPVFPQGINIINMVSLTASMLPIIIGVMVAMQFKLTPIQTAAVGIASMLGSGVATADPEGGFHLQGTGLVINAGLTAALAVGVVAVIGHRLKNYTILLLSTIVILIAGGIGSLLTYPLVKILTEWLGGVVNGATGLQPVLMGLVLSVIFSLMIVSPVSTVGIATAIFMEGVSSGTANLGVTAAGFGLMVAGWKVNGFATSILHVLGSPKIQMANLWSRPITMLPIVCTAAVMGALGGLCGISGTPISAGFGVSGLMGPLAALNYEGWGWTATNLLIVGALFFALPLVLSIAFSTLFRKIGWVRPENYKLEFE